MYFKVPTIHDTATEILTLQVLPRGIFCSFLWFSPPGNKNNLVSFTFVSRLILIKVILVFCGWEAYYCICTLTWKCFLCKTEKLGLSFLSVFNICAYLSCVVLQIISMVLWKKLVYECSHQHSYWQNVC